MLGHALRRTDGVDAAAGAWREALALFTDIGAPEAHDVRALLDGPPSNDQTLHGEVTTTT